MEGQRMARSGIRVGRRRAGAKLRTASVQVSTLSAVDPVLAGWPAGCATLINKEAKVQGENTRV
ncbi:hypothetical protein E2C01_053306 [Portunus trituberculatus]|uniref:Uncharacterized protein n=1 Tax=Portunus trituberculatus TaxID=210409 RepID=A0A5B7GG84_PORTR|nr:hypothetical protein [Portunus trituberculatus]